ncbi:helix-turn-helix domain-containing protein [Sporomusa termitida]|uniref:helix-turn-helix domain-containing protein n=1 Tax=Sporomusa termitida TaxID=2377 RepID=UPI003CCC82E6
MGQEELASALGVSQAEVSRKENGITSIDLEQLVIIATVLKVSVGELIGGPDQTTLPRTG